jgi:hypothetical protein
LRFTPAIDAALEARGEPVITALDLHLLIDDLFNAAQWQGEPLERLPQAWDQRRSAAMISRLIRREVLATDHYAGYGVYRVLAFEEPGIAEQVARLIDPFCYVAYASALHLHGLPRGDQDWNARQSG